MSPPMLAWIAAAALAAAPNGTLAVHPLDVTPPDLAGTLGSIVSEELTQRGATLADPKLIRAFLAAQPDRTCGGGDACLAQLADAAEADRVLYLKVSTEGPKLVLSARLIRKDGGVARAVGGREFPKSADLAASFRAALRAFLPELGFAPAPTASASRAKWRLASYAGIGAAAVAFGVVAGLAISSQNDANKLSDLMDQNGLLPPNDPTAEGLHQSLQTRAGWATGLAVTGAALAAASAALWIWATPDASASVAPVTNGRAAGFVLQGTF